MEENVAADRALRGSAGHLTPRRGCADIEPGGQVAVVRLPDAGLTPVIDHVQEQLNSFLETGPHRVVVDMAKVKRVSSTTVAALLWLNRCCSARGIEVRLRRASRGHVDTLARIGLLDAFELETPATRTSPETVWAPLWLR
jgi:ABC-type transporter Mla MlaB component